MLIGRFTPTNGVVEGIQISRPLQKLLFRIHGESGLGSSIYNRFYDVAPMILRVDLQDNIGNGVSSVIPHLNLSALSEFTTRGEGFALGKTSHIFLPQEPTARYNMVYPVMLAPAGNMDLDSNKFLLCRLSELPVDVTSVEVYGVEVDTPSLVVIGYEKFNIPKGINRQRFPVTPDKALLMLPLEGYEELQITYAGGVVTTKTLFELMYITATRNDLVQAVMSDGTQGVGFMERGIFGFHKCLFLDLEGVQEIEVIRDNNQKAAEHFELTMISGTRDRLLDSTLRRLAGGSVRSSLNTDGTVSLIGADRVRLLNPLNVADVPRLPVDGVMDGNMSILRMS